MMGGSSCVSPHGGSSLLLIAASLAQTNSLMVSNAFMLRQSFLCRPAEGAIMAEADDGGPAQKPKTKQDRFELQFTCNVCDSRNSHSISRHAYTKGTVIVTCPYCNSTHLVADNLNWIEDDFKNLEEFMAKRGEPVTRITTGKEAATAAATAVAALAKESEGQEEVATGDEATPDAIEGITDEQAIRIREAVRAAKRGRRKGPPPN